jgi:hypothetical protein
MDNKKFICLYFLVAINHELNGAYSKAPQLAIIRDVSGQSDSDVVSNSTALDRNEQSTTQKVPNDINRILRRPKVFADTSLNLQVTTLILYGAFLGGTPITSISRHTPESYI